MPRVGWLDQRARSRPNSTPRSNFIAPGNTRQRCARCVNRRRRAAAKTMKLARAPRAEGPPRSTAPARCRQLALLRAQYRRSSARAHGVALTLRVRPMMGLGSVHQQVSRIEAPHAVERGHAYARRSFQAPSSGAAVVPAAITIIGAFASSGAAAHSERVRGRFRHGGPVVAGTRTQRSPRRQRTRLGPLATSLPAPRGLSIAPDGRLLEFSTPNNATARQSRVIAAVVAIGSTVSARTQQRPARPQASEPAASPDQPACIGASEPRYLSHAVRCRGRWRPWPAVMSPLS